MPGPYLVWDHTHKTHVVHNSPPTAGNDADGNPNHIVLPCCAHYTTQDPTFVCCRCHRRVGWCFGGDGDELCDDCHAQRHSPAMDTLYPPPPSYEWVTYTNPFPQHWLLHDGTPVGIVACPMEKWVATIGDSILETPLACTGTLYDVSRALVAATTPDEA